MKKKKLTLIVTIIVLGVLVGSIACRPRGKHVSTPYEAAMAVGQALEKGKKSVLLRSAGGFDEEEQKTLYRVLEAFWPYAFSLECTSDGLHTEVRVSQESPEKRAAAEKAAKAIVAREQAAAKDEADLIRRLHDAVVRGCVYDDHLTAGDRSLLEGTGAPFTAYGALVNGRAVCAGYARAFLLLCRTAGLDALYIADETMDHAWNAVCTGGRVYYVDCTFDDPLPDAGDYAARDFCLITADGMSRSHRWDRTFYAKVMDLKWGISA